MKWGYSNCLMGLLRVALEQEGLCLPSLLLTVGFDSLVIAETDRY